MAGFLTKFGLGAGLFLIVFFFGSFLITQSANQYGISVQDFYDQNIGDIDLDSSYKTLIYESQSLQEGSSIDSGSQDIAQLEGAITAEKEKVGFFDVGRVALSVINKYLSVDPFITTILTSMLVLVFGAAIYAMLSGRTP